MKILWICFVWPEPTSSAAGVRTIELINVLRSAGHEVQVCSPCHPNSFKEKLTEAGVPTEHLLANDSKFDAFIKQYQPDIVFFDRFVIEEQFSWRVKEKCPDALRILDTIDLHSLRRSRQRKVQEGKSALELSALDLQSEDAIREISAIYRCDLSLIISDFEIKLLEEHYSVPAKVLELCRFSYSLPASLNIFQARSNLVVIGNFNHAPNLDCFRLLHDSLWKKIRTHIQARGISDVELHVYGAYPKQDMISLDNKDSGFRVKGWINDAAQTLSQYRVNLAPLRFGAGIKGKISDGWSVGTPCVATTVAAEGMCEGYDFGGRIEDDWESFAQGAASLYCDNQKWQQAQNRGIEIIQSLYSHDLNARSFLEAIDSAYRNKKELRNSNFTGKMLWHHQNRSTEYFSRWIEEKNKNK